MALFKIYSGTANEFPENYPLHPGYAYFFEDSGELVIDTDEGRVDVKAAILVKNNGDEPEFIDVDDLLIAEAADGMKPNAVLVGGENNHIKAIEGVPGAFYFADGLNAPQFGTLPIEQGGTGAITVAAARTNLEVYSKDETKEEVAKSTSVAWTETLYASNWEAWGDEYKQELSISGLTCGADGNIPPIVSWADNQDEYSKIDRAEADADSGKVTFYIAARPENNINVVIIDVK